MVDLSNGAIVLRPWRVEDALWYVDQVADAAIQRFTSEPAVLTVEQAEAGIRKAMGDPIRLSWAVAKADSGELLGNAGIDMATGEVYYWLAASARGRGVATAAVGLITGHAFEVSDRSALYLWVRPGNEASARVAIRAGFLRAPELDRLMVEGDDSVMANYYELTRDRWSCRAN